MTRLASVSRKDIDSASSKAKKILENIDNPRMRELLTNGMLFSAGGASAQDVIQVYSPFLAELGIDFAVHNLHNTRDIQARELAHKMARDIISHGVKIGIVETQIDATAEENEKTMSGLKDLLAIKELCSKEGIGFEKAVELLGNRLPVIEAELEE